MISGFPVFIILLALLFNAFFAAMEISFLSSNRLKVALDESKGNLNGKLIGLFYKKEAFFIAMLLLGNNVALVLFGIYAADVLEPIIKNWGIINSTWILLIQTVLSTLLVLTVSEFMPKALVQLSPNRFLSFAAFPMFILYLVLFIPTQIVIVISSFVMRLFGFEAKNTDKVFSRIDLEHYVQHINEQMQEKEELVNEIQILQNALDFSDIKARDCMIPRTEIIALEVESSMEELSKLFIDTGLSKIIIYRDKIDNIIGYVHFYELFKKPLSIKQILLPIAFVPSAMPGKELLELFSKQSGNIAVVVDEYGGTAGIVTIEDVIEEIFGEIEDEHDTEELLEKKISDKEFIFSARLEIDYLNQTYGLDFVESEEYDTLGGLIIHHLASIPKSGAVLEIEEKQIIIEEVSDRRIESVRLKID